MSLQTEKAIRKVKPVEAVRVTKDNLDELARWTGGLRINAPGLAGENNTEDYVHVPMRTEREVDSRAFPGKVVVREGTRFWVLTQSQYDKSYEKIRPTPKQMPAKKAAPKPSELASKAVPTPKQVGAVAVTPGEPSGVGPQPVPLSPTPELTEEEQLEKMIAEEEAQNASADKLDDSAIVYDETGAARDPQAPETDGDMVQLGAPVTDVALPAETVTDVTEDGQDKLCAKCGSQVVDGVCSKDISHDVDGTVEESAPVAP